MRGKHTSFMQTTQASTICTFHQTHGTLRGSMPQYKNKTTGRFRYSSIGGEQQGLVWFSLRNTFEQQGQYETPWDTYCVGSAFNARVKGLMASSSLGYVS